MLNSTQKELEMVRNTDSFRRLRPNELSGMSLQQLYQIQQQIQQDLQYVDEVLTEFEASVEQLFTNFSLYFYRPFNERPFRASSIEMSETSYFSGDFFYPDSMLQQSGPHLTHHATPSLTST